MASEMREYTVGELVVNFDRKRKPLSSGQRAKMKGSYPYYGATGVFDYVNNYLFDGEYILLAEDGTVLTETGKPVLQRIHGKTWVNNHAHILRNTGLVDFDYLYYLLKNTPFSGAVTGAVQLKISQANMNTVRVFIHTDKNDQRKIAEILRALDSKIELNNKINDNLQQQALAIFRQELLREGELPDGWTSGSLLDIANYLNGLAMQKFRPTDGENGLPVLKIKELRQGSCDASSELCSPSIKSEYIVHDGDVIFSWSGSLLVDLWCGGTCGLNQHLFKVTSEKYPKWFYYAWTAHHLARFVAIAADKATTMGHIKREELAKAEVVIPDAASMERIGGILQPMYDLIISNRIENRKLAALRDTILPQLMSGELDVSALT